MSTWEKKARPTIPEFSLPISRGTPPAAPVAPTPTDIEQRREYGRKWRKTPRAKQYSRRYHERHYVAHPREESEPSPEEVKAIEAEIAKVRREKMLVRAVGKEGTCNPRA